MASLDLLRMDSLPVDLRYRCIPDAVASEKKLSIIPHLLRLWVLQACTVVVVCALSATSRQPQHQHVRTPRGLSPEEP